MNINQTISPTFSAAFQTGNLKTEQETVLKNVLRRLTDSREYKLASERNLDIYFVKPTRKDGIFRAIYYDNKMGSFVRGDNGRFFETNARSSDPDTVNYTNITERIQAAITDIIRGRHKAPYWYTYPDKYVNEAQNMRTAQEMVQILD